LFCFTVEPAVAIEDEKEYTPRTIDDNDVESITGKERWRYGRKPDWGSVKRRGRAVARKPGALPGAKAETFQDTTLNQDLGAPEEGFYTYEEDGNYQWENQYRQRNDDDGNYVQVDTLRKAPPYQPQPQASPNMPRIPNYSPPSTNWSMPNVSTGSMTWSWGWLTYLLIAALILLVVWFILRMRKDAFKGKKAKQKKKVKKVLDEATALTEEELEVIDIHEIEFVDEITLAERSQHFRKAIRLRYLNVLRDLSDKHLIQWQLNKTNYDYYYELANHAELSEAFRGTVDIFEYVWYGKFQLNEEQYEEAKEQFLKMNEIIGNA